MPSLSYMNGLSSVRPPFAVVQADYDGVDQYMELMGELDKLSDDPECQGRPVPIYIVGGSIGMITTEILYIYMLGGVPLILEPGISVEGRGGGDMYMTDKPGRFITDLYSRDNSNVYSIGYVDDPCEAYAYAVEFTSKHVPSEDSGIDPEIVNGYLASNPYRMNHVGTIQRMGGTLFEVYAVNATESAMFRPNKDFMGGEPDAENDTDGIRGRVEVILCGGNPDIVCVGAIAGIDGWLFNVWVPNEASLVDCAIHMLQQDDIPHDVLFVDELELEQAFVMYDEKLRADSMEEDGEGLPDDSDVPNFDYEEYYSEESGGNEPT